MILIKWFSVRACRPFVSVKINACVPSFAPTVWKIILLKIIRGWRDDRTSGDKNLGENGGEKGDVEVIREGADAAHERSGMGDITRGNGIAENERNSTARW